MRPSIRLSLLAVLATVEITLGSAGDRAPTFQACLTNCEKRTCTEPVALSLPLRLTRWTCLDDCKYKCTHYITNLAEQSGTPVQQYYGKWPFWRLLGMQEPASVFFSGFNLLCHWRGAELIQSRIPDGHPMKGYYMTFALVNINAWIWSSVFHTRG